MTLKEPDLQVWFFNLVALDCLAMERFVFFDKIR